ncbi:glycoside hydrolase [Olavius sp. associated proteobacterium Delta 1]|nr:glycoside hydrolase [Olavius sp. associated proteobacterium Delta 1]
MPILKPGKQAKLISFLFGVFLMGHIFIASDTCAALTENIKAVYLPSHCFTDRKISEFTHYAKLTGLNAVVLHVKDPHGWIRWKSNNQLAKKMGAVASNGLVEHTLRRLKQQGFWCIAKLDVFVDHRLVYHNPFLGILDVRTGGPWNDKNGLYWANPFNRKVWQYNIALCQELVDLGFDEIQFDYIRFPSDGDLSVINYPAKPENSTRTECIGKFLETAYKKLKPTGITISVDVFGLVAWKTKDFGVGQQIEAMAPNVDVICPMFYPSHFPKGFLGQQKPAENPLEIMELSTKRMQKRTGKKIRPWIQGFWYTPAEINAQIDGLSQAHTNSWSVWNPSGNYSATYAAIALRLNQVFPEPQFYPPVTEICQNDERVITGKSRIVNLTNYKQGYTIISLEESAKGAAKSYSTLIQVLETLDEGIMDRILAAREIPFSRLTGKYKKKLHLAELICRDLQVNPRVLRPKPIYIDWQNDCLFTRTIPQDHLSNYRIAGEAAFAKDQDIYAKFPGPKDR